jgi:hypothetical protein
MTKRRAVGYDDWYVSVGSMYFCHDWIVGIDEPMTPTMIRSSLENDMNPPGALRGQVHTSQVAHWYLFLGKTHTKESLTWVRAPWTITSIEPSAPFVVLGSKSGYYKIITSEGKICWISKGVEKFLIEKTL